MERVQELFPASYPPRGDPVPALHHAFLPRTSLGAGRHILLRQIDRLRPGGPRRWPRLRFDGGGSGGGVLLQTGELQAHLGEEEGVREVGFEERNASSACAIVWGDGSVRSAGGIETEGYSGNFEEVDRVGARLAHRKGIFPVLLRVNSAQEQSYHSG